MTRTYPLEIALDEFAEDSLNGVLDEIDATIDNLRKYHGGHATHTEEVHIDEWLAQHAAAAVIWTASDVRKVVPHLSDDQALAVIGDCFRIFSPDETANREMIFQVAQRLYPVRTREERTQMADRTINDYARGDARENLVDLLTDTMLWCDDLGEPFDEFYETAKIHHDAERNPQP